MDSAKLTEALKTIAEAGGVFMVPTDRHMSLQQAAVTLDCSTKYLREHLAEFPHAWRMPGGELRIPTRDVAALAERNKLRRATA